MTQKINNSENPKLQLVYHDDLGNNWYEYVDVKDIDAIRGIAAQTADRYVSMMISKDELELAMEACTNAAKESDFIKAFSIIYDIKIRSKMICEANSLLDLAGVYYILEDEDPKMFLESVKQKKQKIWQEDLKCRDFFLRTSLVLTQNLKDIPIKDLFTSLVKTKEVADRIYRHIKSPINR